MESNPVLFVPFLVVMLLFALLFVKGKQKYATFVNAIDKSEYNLRDFFPVGFSLMELLRIQYSTNFDRMLRRQLAELYTEEFTEFYLRVVYAQAGTTAMIALLLGTLFFGATDGDITFLVIGVAMAGILVWASFNGVKTKVNERHQRIALELPELTNQILILSGAGLTLKAALIKIAKEMPGEGPLYQALKQSVDKMELGMTDEQALDSLTVACNMAEVRRFVSVILQNMHRGGTDVLTALSEIGRELWAARKAAAQRIAEETTTKLLFPMMLMLIAVILLVAVPAVMSMSI